LARRNHYKRVNKYSGLEVDIMNCRKFSLLAGIICFAICGLALAGSLPNPNLNNDDTANFYDFVIFANNWQRTGIELAGDFDNNTVDINDLMIFCSYWLPNTTNISSARELIWTTME
jgi:hypothetical protein